MSLTDAVQTRGGKRVASVGGEGGKPRTIDPNQLEVAVPRPRAARSQVPAHHRGRADAVAGIGEQDDRDGPPWARPRLRLRVSRRRPDRRVTASTETQSAAGLGHRKATRTAGAPKTADEALHTRGRPRPESRAAKTGCHRRVLDRGKRGDSDTAAETARATIQRPTTVRRPAATRSPDPASPDPAVDRSRGKARWRKE